MEYIKDRELLKIIEDKNLTYDYIVKELGNISERIDKLREEYTDRIKKSNWYEKYNEVKKNYEDKIESLKDKGIRIEEINNLLKSFENKQNELTNIMELEKNLEQGNKELDSIKNKYIETRKHVRNSRQNYLNALLKDTNTKIEVKEFRNSDDFIRKFRDIIQKKSGFDEDINKITEKCFSGNIIENIHNLSKKLMEINKTKTNDSAYSGKFNNVIKNLNNEQIADINMIIPEDYIEIKYKPNGSDKYKSLKNASAGQRTTAILTFILSNGSNPLILDQPEDDLDNHLIYELVIEKLKICKEKRQVIVVTHNANIPVNGDAELIIAMNSNSEYIEIYKSGGIEDEELKSEICDVMEGGKQAFSMRANRYNI